MKKEIKCWVIQDPNHGQPYTVYYEGEPKPGHARLATLIIDEPEVIETVWDKTDPKQVPCSYEILERLEYRKWRATFVEILGDE